MARRMAGGRASINDIRVSFQRARFGEGQPLPADEPHPIHREAEFKPKLVAFPCPL
jgi:hypothetical protein